MSFLTQNKSCNNRAKETEYHRILERVLTMAESVQEAKSKEEIVATTLKGHKASVLCLDLSSPENVEDLDTTAGSTQSSSLSSTSPLLLSGSEDHTARLWDVREHSGKYRACLCIPTTGDVLSAVFAPNRKSASRIQQQLASPFALDHTVYLAVENTVLEYDLRYAQAPIVAVTADDDSDANRRLARSLGSVLQHQDEVNQISLAYGSLQKQPSNNNKNKKNSKRGGNKRRNNQSSSTNSNTSTADCVAETSAQLQDTELYLAACDDAGTVRFMNVGTGDDNSVTAQSTVVHHDVHGVAVVPCCAFRPTTLNPNRNRNRPRLPLQFASGGTDCKVHLWDLSRPKKPTSSFVVDNHATATDEIRPQVCNPPMVHSMAWSPNGQSLAAGLGDGTVAILSVEDNNRLVQTGLLSEGAHDSSVVSVVYPNFCGSDYSDSRLSSERILCSAGSDGKILFWDLGYWSASLGKWCDDLDEKDQDQGMNTIAALFAEGLCVSSANHRSTNNASSLFGQPPSILFGIPHGRKLNWVTRATSSNSSHHSTVFVADTSSDITCYTIPTR